MSCAPTSDGIAVIGCCDVEPPLIPTRDYVSMLFVYYQSGDPVTNRTAWLAEAVARLLAEPYPTGGKNKGFSVQFNYVSMPPSPANAIWDTQTEDPLPRLPSVYNARVQYERAAFSRSFRVVKFRDTLPSAQLVCRNYSCPERCSMETLQTIEAIADTPELPLDQTTACIADVFLESDTTLRPACCNFAP